MFRALNKFLDDIVWEIAEDYVLARRFDELHTEEPPLNPVMYTFGLVPTTSSVFPLSYGFLPTYVPVTDPPPEKAALVPNTWQEAA